MSSRVEKSSGREGTPTDRKTIYGSLPEYSGAQRALSEEQVSELRDDISSYEFEDIDPEKLAQDVYDALSNYSEENRAVWNENLGNIREVLKEKVTPSRKPSYAWELLSVRSPDFDERLLEVPSEGFNKGLIISESGDRAFLYPKKADGVPDYKHVERWSLNIDNASSVGYDLASENHDRAALEFDGDTVAMLEVEFNEDMVLSDRLEKYLAGELRDYWGEEFSGEGHIDDAEAVIEELAHQVYRSMNSYWRDEIYPDFIEDMDDMVEAGYFVNAGAGEFRRLDQGNMGLEIDFPEGWEEAVVTDEIDPEELWDHTEVLIVDAGEYEEDIDQNLDEDDPFLTREEKIEIGQEEEQERRVVDWDDTESDHMGGSTLDIA